MRSPVKYRMQPRVGVTQPTPACIQTYGLIRKFPICRHPLPCFASCFAHCLKGDDENRHLSPITSAVDDYARVLTYLVKYWEWDIDAYRGYLNPNIRADHAYTVLCVLAFLTMAEWLHLRYSGLTPEELRERIYAIGRRTFAVLAAIPRLGVIIIRILEIVTIANSPALACSLIVASMFPALICPVLLSSVQKLKVWIANRREQRRESEHNGAEAITLVVMDHSESEAISAQTMIEDIEASLRHNGHPLSSEEWSGLDPVADERI
ncbi:hypothetical protein EDC04DRAFT_2734042 [Pisolithus marmoratus]|nr:hypothetical protein EDC04DRAFT_2734042 [Pisolithus marmoratus]